MSMPESLTDRADRENFTGLLSASECRACSRRRLSFPPERPTSMRSSCEIMCHLVTAWPILRLNELLMDRFQLVLFMKGIIR